MSALVQVIMGQPAAAVAAGLHASASAKATYNVDLSVALNSTFQWAPFALWGGNSVQKEQKDAAIAQFPDLEKLFGSQSFCECEHCRSVYSPAAYLVDLLHLFLDDTTQFADLDKLTTTIDLPPIIELLKRRPDLIHITLSCENTNTPLPYIDLVNEVLESFIDSHLVGGKWSDTPQSKDTITPYDTGLTPSDELRAVPQNVDPNGTVYPHLANEAVYPMSLPFDRPLEVVRSYLAHLGTNRAEMMKVFRAPSAVGVATVVPAAHDIATEVLGLSSTQAKIIGGSFDKEVWEFYGYTKESGLLDLNKVPELLRRTGMDLNDLLGLLKTQFINLHVNDALPNPAAIRIQYPGWPHDACDVSEMKIVTLEPSGGTEPHRNLDRIHRFVRLWRVLGWTMRDLDRALTALGGELSGDTLDKLAAIKSLATDLNRPVAELLVLLADIDTWGEDSTFARLFQSVAMVSDADAQAAFDAIGAGVNPPLDNKLVDAVAAVLTLTTDDLERIRSYLDSIGLPEPILTLNALSVFLRHGMLAKALGIRVRDLITLLFMAPADANPFVASDPGPTVKFVQLGQAVLDSGFSIPLINYLFRGEAEPTRHPAPTRALIESSLSELQKGLAAVFQETVVPEQPTAEDLRAALDVAKNVLGETDPTTGKLVALSPDEALAVLDPRESQFNGLPLALPGRTAFVKQHFTDFLSTTDQDTLFDNSFASDPSEARFLENVSTVLKALLPWLRVKEQELLVIQAMASAVGVDEKVASALLTDKVDTDDDTVEDKYLLHSNDDPQRPALHDFLSLIDDSGNAVTFDVDSILAAPVATFVRLFKAAAYVTAFGMTEPELRLFASSQTPVKISDPPPQLNFNLLPLAPVDATDQQAREHFALWQELATYYRLREVLPKSEKTLPDFLAPLDPKITSDARIKTLVEVTGWEQALVELLLVGFKIEVTDLLDLDRLFDFHLAAQLTRRLGAHLKYKEGNLTQLEPLNVFDWAATPPDASQANAVIQMVKGRYERAQWLEVARSLNDPIREKQRSALVDFLVARMAWPHPQLKKDSFLKDSVTELQRKLNVALASFQAFMPTLLPLEVDGFFGPKTQTAVETFQQVNKLTADGIVDPMTWAALDRAVGVVFDKNSLLEYFLIDVEMSSCMLTSRIKQATSSVQLFIHRCLLNLEPAVSPADIDPEWWEWMKNYRVWEANRKVFLYPENWIEPELRLDKTPFFKDLETELLQNEITDEMVEKALVNYLYKLDEVARLDIRGLCSELIPEQASPGQTQQEIYHVFGRTWNPPYVYYYRKGTFNRAADSDGEWSPWERIALDVEGDHLIPVVYNRRLYLFWPVFKERPDTKQPESGDRTSRWELRLAWGEYFAGSWSGKRTASDIASEAKYRFQWPDESSQFGEGIKVATVDLPFDARPSISNASLFWFAPKVTDNRLLFDILFHTMEFDPDNAGEARVVYYLGTYVFACGRDCILLSETESVFNAMIQPFFNEIYWYRVYDERVVGPPQSLDLPPPFGADVISPPDGFVVTPAKGVTALPSFVFQDGPDVSGRESDPVKQSRRPGGNSYFVRSVVIPAGDATQSQYMTWSI